MRPTLVFTALTCWLTTAVTSVALAQGHNGAQPMARYVVDKLATVVLPRRRSMAQAASRRSPFWLAWV